MSEFRPRSNSEILDAAFEIYRGHFPVFFAIGLISALPSTAIVFFSRGATIATFAIGSPIFDIVVAMWVLALVIYPFVTAAMVSATAAAFLGNPVDLQSAFRVGLRHPFRILLVEMRKGLFIALGGLLFFIPSAIVFKRYFAVPTALILEDLHVNESVRRSRALADGNGTRIFALLLGTWFFLFILSAMVQGIAGAIKLEFIAAALYLVVLAGITPFYTVVSVILYYDIRIRKEAYDIDLMSQAIDAAVPAPAA